MQGLFIRFPGWKRKALTLSYDDGVEQDKRLISVMRKNGLKGTFNLNSGLYVREGTEFTPRTIHRRMTRDEAVKVYNGSDIEVAVHGFTHAPYDLTPINLCLQEIVKDRTNLERQFHGLVRGMAYPGGNFNDEVVDILHKAGIVYGRTVQSSGKFDLPRDWLRLKPTCHHNDDRLRELAERFIKGEAAWGSWLFYLWGHSYEFEEQDNWDIIEDFAAYMGGRDDLWYATNIEIYNYVNCFKQLVFSMDRDQAFNPTARKLYFEVDGVEMEIGPGETKLFHTQEIYFT